MRLAPVLAVLVFALAACGGAGGESGAPTSPHGMTSPATTTGKTLDYCAHEDATTKIIEFKSADAELEGALVGNGDVGVVLAHQLHSNLCSWLPFAKQLAARGALVLAFDFPSTSDLDRHVLAAARALRAAGAQTIALAGASMGGTAVLVAASRDPQIARVANLSGPREFEGLVAGPAVRRLQAEALFVAAREDSPFVDDVRALYRSAATSKKDLLIVPGFDHGTDLLDDDGVGERLLKFLVGS